jgi:hypothetical protein
MAHRALTLPNELPFWELESHWTPEFSEGDCRLKHKLWPKEGPEVKLAI